MQEEARWGWGVGRTEVKRAVIFKDIRERARGKLNGPYTIIISKPANKKSQACPTERRSGLQSSGSTPGAQMSRGTRWS